MLRLLHHLSENSLIRVWQLSIKDNLRGPEEENPRELQQAAACHVLKL